MSGSLEALTEAIEANTAIQEKVLAALKGSAVSTSKATTTKATTTKATTTKANKANKITVDDIASAFGEYLSVKDKEVRDMRMANVRELVSQFGVKKATEIDPKNFEEALALLQEYIDKEESGDGGDEGDDDGALV